MPGHIIYEPLRSIFVASIFRSTFFSNLLRFTNQVFCFLIIYSTKKKENVFYILINICIQLFITNTIFDAIHYNSTSESSVQENSRVQIISFCYASIHAGTHTLMFLKIYFSTSEHTFAWHLGRKFKHTFSTKILYSWQNSKL